MKRTQEKIKDIVEPQAFDEVRNVAADPARSLAAYRFTDATSDLLARWLDSLADLPRGRGTARALAGARGVGKSHTLAVFGALAGGERLRQEVEDTHVATSARRLSGRKYTVVAVERGTRTTLAEEMAAAFTHVFGGNEVQWGNVPSEMLAVAASRANDSTLVLLIDTGFERPARVRRDDGPALGEIARVATGANAFVALALDDDISGADGPNVAIAGSYRIDYLDQEHLFRIADTYILRKNEQARASLHEIYLHLRASVPQFNWSEPRFAALYPVHPLVAEVSASVRLHAPAFAFLPFASEAARRATTRPALSLILLDEVFDRAEADLRKSAELKEAFEIYDDLATRGVSQFPVMQRLEAKLVLKSLFILSLDGSGATPPSLCAALLVSDESSQKNAVARMRDVLARFREAAPGDALGLSEEASDNGEPRYRLQISATDKFKAALDRSVENLPTDDASALALLGAGARARFEDWPFDAGHHAENASVNFSLVWRGSERRGHLVWKGGDELAPEHDAAHGCELELLIYAPGTDSEAHIAGEAHERGENKKAEAAAGEATLGVVWRPAQVSADELQALRRLSALRTDDALAAEFGETAHASATALAAQAERAWTRVYMDDGVLFIEGERHEFTDHARAERTLAGALAETFAPRFAARYPRHPQFEEMLREIDVERLTAGLLAVGGKSDEEVQRLARTFALPLGLVEERGSGCALVSGEGASGPDWVRETLALTNRAGEAAHAPVETIRRMLGGPPYGLKLETQNLILAALVAQRRADLVLEGGERITRRDLSRPVRWDALVGVARPSDARLGAEDLTAWARLLTGRSDLPRWDGKAERDLARKALTDWLQGWNDSRLAENFEALPDAALTTRVWRTYSTVRKHFGAAAESLKAAFTGEITLEEGLERVADAFEGSEEKFAVVARELESLMQLIENFAVRERARAYMLSADATNVAEIETVRRELLSIARDRESLLDADRNERFKRLWFEFHARYSEHYAAAHEETLQAPDSRLALDALLASDRWREFEALSRLVVINRRYWESVQNVLRRAETIRCHLPVRQLLAEQPSCACAFHLSLAETLRSLPSELEVLVEEGLSAYRRTLALLGKPLQHALEQIAAREEAKRDLAMRARLLAHAFGQGTLPHRFSRMDVQLIERAALEMDAPQPLRVHPPTEDYGLLTREELGARLEQWLDDLPANAALVELVTNGDRAE